MNVSKFAFRDAKWWSFFTSVKFVVNGTKLRERITIGLVTLRLSYKKWTIRNEICCFIFEAEFQFHSTDCNYMNQTHPFYPNPIHFFQKPSFVLEFTISLKKSRITSSQSHTTKKNIYNAMRIFECNVSSIDRKNPPTHRFKFLHKLINCDSYVYNVNINVEQLRFFFSFLTLDFNFPLPSIIIPIKLPKQLPPSISLDL